MEKEVVEKCYKDYNRQYSLGILFYIKDHGVTGQGEKIASNRSSRQSIKKKGRWERTLPSQYTFVLLYLLR